MKEYTNLFTDILEKPELYIGEKSITKLYFFMHGYSYGYQMDKKIDEDTFYSNFRTFVEERYELNNGFDWATTILFMTGGSEYRAFERVKVLWNEYKSKVVEGKK